MEESIPANMEESIPADADQSQEAQENAQNEQAQSAENLSAQPPYPKGVPKELFLFKLFKGDLKKTVVFGTVLSAALLVIAVVLAINLILLQGRYNLLAIKTSVWTKLSAQEQTRLKSILDIDAEIDSLNAQKSSLESEVAGLETEKSNLQSTIAKLQGDIVVLKGQPISFPAGYFIAGTDFDVGRYKIYGGSSNFVVHSASGSLRVNIILGGSYGVDEYIYTFSKGDEIEASSSFKLVLVE